MKSSCDPLVLDGATVAIVVQNVCNRVSKIQIPIFDWNLASPPTGSSQIWLLTHLIVPLYFYGKRMRWSIWKNIVPLLVVNSLISRLPPLMYGILAKKNKKLVIKSTVQWIYFGLIIWIYFFLYLKFFTWSCINLLWIIN